MKRHHWTFLYVPSHDGGVRTYHVDKRVVGALAGAITLLSLLLVLISWGFVNQEVVLDDVSTRDREIMALRSELFELERTVSVYETQMARNYQMQEQANLIAGLGPLDPTLTDGGIGGQGPVLPPDAEGFDRISRQRIAQIREQLSRLMEHAEFQKQGYEQVLDTLREDQRLRDSTPSIRPLHDGYLSSRYGRRVDPFTGKMAFHRGVDFSSPVGTPVYATASGTVRRASRHGSLGKLVEVDHGNGVITRYGHLNDYVVRKAGSVERGDLIGHVGNTGRSTGPHLHYEVVKNGRSENPWLYIIRE